jgi:hypothetical protein
MARMVTRMSLNVTVYVHYVSCLASYSLHLRQPYLSFVPLSSTRPITQPSVHSCIHRGMHDAINTPTVPIPQSPVCTAYLPPVRVPRNQLVSIHGSKGGSVILVTKGDKCPGNEEALVPSRRLSRIVCFASYRQTHSVLSNLCTIYFKGAQHLRREKPVHSNLEDSI